jgi:hypothetical protein
MALDIAPTLVQLAEQALARGTVLRRTARYTVYAVPAGFMDHFALVLLEPGFQELADLPASLVLPVRVHERKGYLIVRDALRRLFLDDEETTVSHALPGAA